MRLSDRKRSIRVESSKLVIELLKHTATLSSGSLLVIFTFADKFSKDHSLNWQQKTALWLFVATIVLSFTGMMLMTFHGGAKGLEEKDLKGFAVVFFCTVFCFSSAFAVLASTLT